MAYRYYICPFFAYVYKNLSIFFIAKKIQEKMIEKIVKPADGRSINR